MNQNQITVTRGDDRTLAIVIDDEYAGDTAVFVVEDLFDKTLTVDEDPGSGYATANVELVAEDTENAPDLRRAYRYDLSVTHDGDNLTILRGLFVVQPDLPT
jgi:hypothetical protein